LPKEATSSFFRQISKGVNLSTCIGAFDKADLDISHSYKEEIGGYLPKAACVKGASHSKFWVRLAIELFLFFSN